MYVNFSSGQSSIARGLQFLLIDNHFLELQQTYQLGEIMGLLMDTQKQEKNQVA